jgi:hypothetical protein
MQPPGVGCSKRVDPIGNEEERHGGGQGEADPGRDSAEQPRSKDADGNTDLATSRAWQELAQRDEIGVRLVVELLALYYLLVPKVAQVRDWPTEGRQA